VIKLELDSEEVNRELGLVEGFVYLHITNKAMPPYINKQVKLIAKH